MLFCYKDKNLFFLLGIIIRGKPKFDPSTASPATAYEPAQEARGELEPLGSPPQGVVIPAENVLQPGCYEGHNNDPSCMRP